MANALSEQRISSENGMTRSDELFGRRIPTRSLDALGLSDRGLLSAPTWRGWVVGLLSVAGLCKLVPVTDYVLQNTRLTLNILPFSSLFAVFALVAIYNLLLYLFRRPLGLTRQDIALVFAMTMIANHIPGHGFMGYLTGLIGGVNYYANGSNHWETYIHPHIPAGFTVADPGPDGSRPVEWFYSGLPPGQEIPWSAWIGPYSRWALMMLLMYGMLFAVCALLWKQWSQRERLPFPLAQVPDTVLSGLETGGKAKPNKTRSFLRDPLALWGIGLVFAFHSWNALGDYIHNWPVIPIRDDAFGNRYLTEPPLSYLNPVKFILYPSVIGLTFLVSTEISFSLWFFYWILKVCVVIAIVCFGLGINHRTFHYNPSGWEGTFINQGTGALIAMVLMGLWMARGPLKRSLRQAIGVEAPDEEDVDSGLTPRALWLILAASFCGMVAWLKWFNVDFHYAVFAVIALLVLTTGIMRLVSEGGVFYPQAMTSPLELTALATTPATMGSANLVPLSIWNRLACFDYFRLTPTVPLITSIQVGSLARVKRGSLFMGMGAAIVLALVLSFFGLLSTMYHAEGGAARGGWVHRTQPKRTYRQTATRVAAVDAFEAKTAALAAEGKSVPPEQVPEVARRDTTAITWIVVGMAVMFTFMFLRTRVFWWPHPIGYALWTGQRAISLMWFSFFLGWLIKSLVVKYGGLQAYERWKRFFVGMIVGEAAAVFVWIGIWWITGHQFGYRMHFN